MKSNTSAKSSITLPPAELAIVNQLMKNLKAKSKVEVIRRGLNLLKQNYESELLQEQFKKAAGIVRDSNRQVLEELDSLTGEGLVNED